MSYDDDPFGAPTNAPLPSADGGGGGGFDDFDMSPPQQSAPAHAAAPFQVPAQPAADTPLAHWQTERRQVLLKRMTKAADAKKEQAAMARNELDKFYEERQAKIARNQQANRTDEKGFKEEMAHVMASGSDWEKVAKVCDLTPKVAGKGGSTRDIDRMRTVLIELKNEKKAAV